MGKISIEESGMTTEEILMLLKNNNDNKLSVSKAKSTGHIDGCIGVFNSEIAYTRAKEIYQDSIPEYFEI